MKETITLLYVSPFVEMIEVEVEKGYASSSGNDDEGGMKLQGWEII